MPFRVSAQAPQTPPSPACFPGLLAPNKDREIGGGRATRQPGQVRKEAALTRSGSGRSSVSYLFFERIAPNGPTRPALDSVQARIPQKWVPVLRSGYAPVKLRKPVSRDNHL